MGKDTFGQRIKDLNDFEIKVNLNRDGAKIFIKVKEDTSKIKRSELDDLTKLENKCSSGSQKRESFFFVGTTEAMEYL